MKNKLLLILIVGIMVVVSGCDTSKKEYNPKYFAEGYKEGFDSCYDIYIEKLVQKKNIYNFEDIPNRLKLCAIGYYVDNYKGWERIGFPFNTAETILFNEQLNIINCSKYT